MGTRKKKKSRKMRGSRYHGYAAKKHKGKGNRGGKGMAGSGKRADQKKSYVLKHLYPYFGGKGYTSRRTAKKKQKIMNIKDLNKYDGEVDLKDYKILSEGELTKKLTVKCQACSKKAREKIEKAGGKIETIPNKKNINEKKQLMQSKENKEKKPLANKENKKEEKKEVEEK